MLKSESKNQSENAAEEKNVEIKILFADDMEINKMIFEKMISPWEIAVDYVKDGKAAVEAARNRIYQLVFLDNMMPEMTGSEAAVQIRRFSPVPLVIVTADMPQDWEEWKECGFNDFMTKPFEIEVLKRILKKYLPANFSQGLCNTKQDFFRTKTQKMLLSRKTLETFAEETEELLSQLKKYMEQDKELLRMKVHGIKGACRQVGQVSMGEMAENMEIAVEADNMSYVQQHMDDFILKLKKTVEIVREQIASLPKETSDENELVINEKTVLWRELKEAFADYAIDDIERILEQLKRTDLTEEEREVLLKAEKCGNEFEYEEGYNLL